MSPRLEGATPASGVGAGRSLRLEVVDPRADPLRLGETDDVYHRRIELDRAPQELMLEVFARALSGHGYRLRDDAATTFRVGVIDVAAAWAAEFGASVRCSVSLSVEIRRGDDPLGSRRWVERGEESLGATSDGTREGSRCLSTAIERAVQTAAGDPELAALVRRESLIVEEDAGRTGDGAPGSRGREGS